MTDAVPAQPAVPGEAAVPAEPAVGAEPAVPAGRVEPSGDDGSVGEADEGGAPWWRSSVCYEIYPRSFADSNGDGQGDLEGIRQRLDHLSWLGVDAIWICPFFPSPMADNGYDITDFCAIDPRYGTLEDFDRLLADAHRRGIRLLVDWVPNHTSDRHPWFVESSSGRSAAKRDWYYWRDEPNNWRAALGNGSAWALDQATDQYYLHYFLPAQPDLNWYNDDVVDAMLDTVRFWLDRGVDGLRIDSATCLGKDLTFADDDRSLGGMPVAAFTDGPRNHEVLRQVRAVADSYPGQRVLVGEVDIRTEVAVISYYGDGHELELCFNFPPLDAPWDPIVWRDVITAVESRLGPAHAWPVWTMATHDSPRVRSRYGSLARARAAAVLVLTLRGTVFVYQGEELGLCDLDPCAGKGNDPGGRDRSRGPIPWGPQAPHGWPGATTWLPFPPDSGTDDVATQHADPGSIAALYRRLIRIRAASAALRYGTWSDLDPAKGVLGYRRALGDEQWAVLINFSDQPKSVPLDGDWEVRVDSRAYQGRPDMDRYPDARYMGQVEPDQALLLSLGPR